MGGPLTESESDLLNSCVELFKSYFQDRYDLSIRNIKLANYYQSDSYVSEPESIINELFITDASSAFVSYFIEPGPEL